MLNGEGRGRRTAQQRSGDDRGIGRVCASGRAPGGGQCGGRGAAGEDAALMRLDDRVRAHMSKWFGPVVDSWKMLRAYPLWPRRCRSQRHAEWEQSPVRAGRLGRRIHVW